MKLNFRTLCACLALVAYSGIVSAGGGDSSSYRDKGKQSEEPKKTRTAAEWEARVKEYKVVEIRFNEALGKIKNLETQDRKKDCVNTVGCI